MIIIHPDNHEKAINFWKNTLGGKPNGARTLGAAQAKYLAPIFEPYYDMMITYASDIPVEIPHGVKKIAIMWHQNFPWSSGITVWRRTRWHYIRYDVDYFCNEPHIIELIREAGGSAFLLPRFIDTTTLPAPPATKIFPTLWFGNRWAEFGGEFEKYKMKNKHPYWLSHGVLGLGEKKLYEIDREDALQIVNEAKKVWAIGVSQLEAQYFGAEIVSYRGEILPFYDQETIQDYAGNLLQEIQDRRKSKS